MAAHARHHVLSVLAIAATLGLTVVLLTVSSPTAQAFSYSWKRSVLYSTEVECSAAISRNVASGGYRPAAHSPAQQPSQGEISRNCFRGTDGNGRPYGHYYLYAAT